jgi:ankyrin repeat protein
LEELPESLDGTYERILREIKKPNQGHAHRLLQCLVAAIRPLQVRELAEVLAVDFDTERIPKLNPDWRWQDQEEAVISACSSLVTIVNGRNSQIVQFSHFSVKEFLTADRLAEPIRDVSYYHIRLEAAHTTLAQACLGIFFGLPDYLDRNCLNVFPMVRYAADNWHKHARLGNTLSRIKDGMECLFDADKPHFARWLRVCRENWDNYNEFAYDLIYRRTPHAETPLYQAASLGFTDLTRHLITEHPEQISEGEKKMNPIHMAACGGHVEILSLLLAHGADVDVRGFTGATALHDASLNGQLEAGRCLLDHGADINALDRDVNNGNTPLYRAVFYRHVEYTRMLLERGAAINIPGRDGNTPLHKGAGAPCNSLQLTQVLLEHGADVNARNSKDQTPLHSAEAMGNIEALSSLLKYGADVHARNADGRTACQEASLRYPSPNLAFLELLRQYGDTSV